MAADVPNPPAPAGPAPPGTTLPRALLATARIAGVFCLLVSTTLLALHFTATTNDPWKSPQLLALKERLVAEPKNEQLKQNIRRLDLEFRQKYRRRLALDSSGGWLLLVGAVLLAATARKAATLQAVPPSPRPDPDAAQRSLRFQSRARWSVAFTGGLAAMALVAVYFSLGTTLPRSDAAWQKLLTRDDAQNSQAPRPPSLAESQVNSPRFRGWDGNGVTTQTNIPLAWGSNTSASIAWKSAVDAPGHSSPVIWGDRVFLTGGTAQKREVICFAADSGRVLWRRAIENVPGSPAKLPSVPEETTFAASTGATDGRLFFAIFANGDLAALTFEGTVAWSKSLAPMNNAYGYATSLALWQDKLIVQLDQGENQPQNSRLLAFATATGRPLWERSRPTPVSWATPIVIDAASRTQIITLANPWVISYSFTDGNELWRANLLENEVVPSPVFAGGLVFIVSPSAKLIALRPDGAGDVTQTHVAWTAEDNPPDVASPVSNGELVFAVNSGGVITCFDAKSGSKVWTHDLNMELQASPALAGSRLFVLGVKGVAVVVEAGRQFNELARSELPDRFIASPAFAQGRVYLRGETNLFCIGPATVLPAK